MGKEFPIHFVGAGAVVEAVADVDLVAFQEGCQFEEAVLVGAVPVGDQDCGGVFVHMGEEDGLPEGSGFGVLVIEGLGDGELDDVVEVEVWLQDFYH